MTDGWQSDENEPDYEELELQGSFVVPIHAMSPQDAFYAGFGQLRRFLLEAMDKIERSGVDSLEIWQIREILTSLDLVTRDATDDEKRLLGGDPHDLD